MSLYIDPTTGGLGLQIILGFLVGGFVTVKLMWGRFLSLFRRGSDTDEENTVSPAKVQAETAGDD